MTEAVDNEANAGHVNLPASAITTPVNPPDIRALLCKPPLTNLEDADA